MAAGPGPRAVLALTQVEPVAGDDGLTICRYITLPVLHGVARAGADPEHHHRAIGVRNAREDGSRCVVTPPSFA